MRKIKRIIALVTVAMFLLSLAAPAAFAATKEDAFGRLNALSVAVGDATGNPQYDKNFTRAEAAAIMVNLSGMKSAIEAAKGTTKFKDVPASHWASGVINLAVGAGIIKGFPDGTYRPDENVTYAQMSAMLVGVLGYTPKLQGTWPSNVIGKAAQLGLLDGLTVSDYNAAAVRSNVFLASDNALDTNVLKEMKDGYEEGGTLMVDKLSVTVKAKATVTATPAYGALDKGKINIGGTTYSVIDSINPDDYMGLEAEAWVKDDKVFFLNVKTDASNIITDTIDKAFDGATEYKIIGATTAAGYADGAKVNEADVDEIELDTGDKRVLTDAGTIFYNNYALVTDANLLNDQSPVKVIVGTDGKADYVFGLSYSTAIVDSVSTADEKITLDADSVWAGASSTITLKNKKAKIYRNGQAAALADLKKGDVVSYVDGTDSKLIYANDTVKTGKITGIVDDGTWHVKVGGVAINKFKFALGSESIKSTRYVLYSTNDADTFTTAVNTGSFASVLNKDVKVKVDKDGKVAYVIASSSAGSNEIYAVVKDIKKVSSTETKNYIYVGKFDGTETFYEVNKDTKINGDKVSEYALKATDGSGNGDMNYSAAGAGARSETGPHIANANLANEIKVGDIVKFTLTSDNVLDNIVKETVDASAVSYTVDKDNNTILVNGGSTVLADANTKILWVKSQVAPVNPGNAAGIYNNTVLVTDNNVIDDVDTADWTAVKAADGVVASPASLVKEAGKAKYIVIFDSAANVSSSDFFGIVLEKGKNDKNEDYIKIGYDDKAAGESKLGTYAVSKRNLVKFTLKADTTKLNTCATEIADNVTINAVAYSYFKVDSVSGAQIKVIGTDASYTTGGPSDYVLFDTTKTKFWDADPNNSIAPITANEINGKYVQLYDVKKADGTTGTDGVFDFVFVVKN